MTKETYTSNFIKGIAILAMTIDHLAWLFYPGFSSEPIAMAMHFIGRLTAPIMWFFVAEGYAHTRDKKKYFLRLMTLAVASHFTFCFAFGLPYLPFSHGIFNQTSVIWSLALAMLVLMVRDWKGNKLVQVFAIVLLIALCFPADWSSIATVSILYFYAYRENFKNQAFWLFVWISLYALIYFLFIDKTYALIQFGTLNTLFLLKQYNGKRGEAKWMGKFFYYYYPLHMVVIGLLRLWLYGNINILF